jgi:hypothetical protein
MSTHLEHHPQQMVTVPVLILACIDHGDTGPGPIMRGASIYPTVQYLLLAAVTSTCATRFNTPDA